MFHNPMYNPFFDLNGDGEIDPVEMMFMQDMLNSQRGDRDEDDQDEDNLDDDEDPYDDEWYPFDLDDEDIIDMDDEAYLDLADEEDPGTDEFDDF